MENRTRIERDEMGEVRVPAAALYGAQTQRAVENFPISGLRFGREFIRALGLIKKAAAAVNSRLGVLDPAIARAIEQAADEVIEGRHDDQFVVDIFQTGSGTSTNMNANEVIATLASRMLARPVHPNDHVNRSQSSNDVIPSAIHISTGVALQRQLLPAMNILKRSLQAKADSFHDIVKVGRTHLQDAVPLRLGQEFSGYARQVESAADRVRTARDSLWELALGGTAVGTGLNAPAGYGHAAAELIANWSGLPFRETVNHFEAQAARDAAGFVSGALRSYATAMVKIANDIRLLASGPRCGIGELRLPAIQPGSSIMPGKVNPVIIESTLMACTQVIGYDAAISWCCAMGQLELNAMLPLIAFNLLEGIKLLSNATNNLTERCINGLEPDRERIAELMDRSYAVVAALSPVIGHEKAAAIAQEAALTGRPIRDIARSQFGVSDDVLAERLNADLMTR